MLQSVVSKYERIMEILAAKGISEKLNGYNNETANEVVTGFEPFKEATDVLEAEKYPTVQFVVLWLQKLESHCNTGPDDAEVLRVLKERCLRLMEEKVELQTLHRIATFMCPPFRQLKIMSVTERDETLNAVRQICDEISVAVRSTSNTPTPNNSTDASSSEMYDSGVSPERLAASLSGVGAAKGHPGGGDGGGSGSGSPRRRVRQQRGPKTKARKRQMRSYARYVRTLMRTIHPNRRLSKAAIACMDSFLSDMQVRLSEEARRLCRLAGRRTLKAADVRAAVHLLLPGELAVHAKREADVALKLLAAKSATERTRARSVP